MKAVLRVDDLLPLSEVRDADRVQQVEVAALELVIAGPGIDFIKQFRPKFTDKTLKVILRYF
jgi:hypothetical protein